MNERVDLDAAGMLKDVGFNVPTEMKALHMLRGTHLK